MILKTIVFLCLVYVVKGYVAVNLLKDDLGTQKSSLSMGPERSSVMSNCSPLGCLQICRRLGLKGGLCINGKCKCDLFIEIEGVEIETPPKIDLERTPSISECSPLGCAQLCRRIGLKGGVCVHGKCKCDLFIDLEGDSQKTLTMCDWSSCDRGCRSIGYPGGICLGSECRCHSRPFEYENSNRIENLDDEVRVMTLGKPSPIISDCNPFACEQLCRRIFLKGGVCVHGRCKCDIIIESEETNKIPMTVETEHKYRKAEMTLKDKSSVEVCNTTECVQMCRRIGFIDGTCDVFKDACNCF